MKRFFLWLASGAFALGLAASANAAPASAATPLRILCTFYPTYVMTLNVVGDLATEPGDATGSPAVVVECMTGEQTGCLHDYQLSPADMRKVAGADLLVANGAGMEAFLQKAVRQAQKRRPQMRVIEASEGIKLILHESFGVPPEGNPHVWVSLGGAIAQVRNIAKGLAAADPAHAKNYEANAARYIEKLAALQARMHAALDPLPHREIVTFHEAFPYFASEFGLKIAAIIEREPGSEPSAKELAGTIRIIRQAGVKAIFTEPQYPAKSAKMIERETGVPLRILDPAVNGPRLPGKGAKPSAAELDAVRDSYLRTMEANLKTLQEALK